MVDTLPNVALPADEWVDLYAATGISAGTRIQIQFIGGSRIKLVTKATEPTESDGFNTINDMSLVFVSSDSPSGVWAMSVSSHGSVNVGAAQ